MDRREAIRFVRNIFDEGRADVLEKLRKEFQGSDLFQGEDITYLWYGVHSLEKCNVKQLGALVAALSAAAPERRTDVKQLFIDTLTTAATKDVKTMLNVFAKTEQKLGKDVGEFSREELQQAFTTQAMYNKTTIRRCLGILKKYCAWRKEAGYPTHELWDNNPFSADEVDLRPGLKAKCCGSPEALYKNLADHIPVDDGYLAPVAAVLAWLGFSLPEMLTIRNEDVAEDGSVVCDREVPVVLRKILSEYKRTKTVERTGAATRSLELEDIGFFLKRLTDKPSGKGIDRYAIANAALSADILSLRDIGMSGYYYRMLQMEQQGRVTKDDIIRVFNIGKANQPAFIRDRLGEHAQYKDVFHSN